MASTEQPDDRTVSADSVSERAEPAATTELSVSIPDDATDAEAAAISAAISAHITDRQRAAAAAAATESTEYTDQWTLAGRLSRFGKRRRPRNVERGEEWTAAARARY